MSVIRNIRVKLEPAVLLSEDGFGDLTGRLQEAIANGEGPATYLCTAVTMEVEPAGEPAEEAADLIDDQTAE
jgi:hypothetical protein